MRGKNKINCGRGAGQAFGCGLRQQKSSRLRDGSCLRRQNSEVKTIVTPQMRGEK